MAKGNGFSRNKKINLRITNLLTYEVDRYSGFKLKKGASKYRKMPLDSAYRLRFTLGRKTRTGLFGTHHLFLFTFSSFDIGRRNP